MAMTREEIEALYRGILPTNISTGSVNLLKDQSRLPPSTQILPTAQATLARQVAQQQSPGLAFGAPARKPQAVAAMDSMMPPIPVHAPAQQPVAGAAAPASAKAEWYDNPFVSSLSRNANMLLGLGSGLMSGTSFAEGLSAGGAGAMQGGNADRQYASEAKAAADKKTQRNQTLEYLAKQFPDLAAAYDSGAPIGEVWGEAMNRLRPQEAGAAPKPIEVNGQLIDPTTFEVLGDFRTPETNGGPSAPAGYRWNTDGGLEFIPGGPHDPANAALKPPTDADVRAAKLSGVIQGDKELLLGANGIYDKLADPWSQAVGAEVGVGGFGAGRPGLALAAPDYQSATNALTNIAQSYLYAISGQAAPAGEVAKIIESVTPKFGEDASSVKNKKARLASYIAAIEASKYDVPTGGASNQSDPLGIR